MNSEKPTQMCGFTEKGPFKIKTENSECGGDNDETELSAISSFKLHN